MAFSLINLPTIITVSLAISLVPAIAEAAAHNYIIKKGLTRLLGLQLLLLYRLQ